MARPLACAALAGLLLSGCGIGSTTAGPGVAVRVGDQTVSTDTVDRDVDDVCDLQSKQTQQAAPVTRALARQSIVQALALRSAAEQIAEEYDIEPADSYQSSVAQLRRSTQGATKDQLDSLEQFAAASAYVQAVSESLGRKVLADQGQQDPAITDVGNAGEKAFVQWLDDHDIEFAPVYGVQYDGQGNFSQADTSLSVADSDQAKAAAQTDPQDPAYSSYVAGLPASQVCG